MLACRAEEDGAAKREGGAAVPGKVRMPCRQARGLGGEAWSSAQEVSSVILSNCKLGPIEFTM